VGSLSESPFPSFHERGFPAFLLLPFQGEKSPVFSEGCEMKGLFATLVGYAWRRVRARRANAGRPTIAVLAIAAAMVCGIPVHATAVTLFEDFGGGIPSDQWEVFHEDAASAAWTITAPDTTGRLHISKIADTDSLTATKNLTAGIRSRFFLVGDFSAYVEFDLVDFPGTNTAGWNEALLRLGTTTEAPVEYAFMTLRFSGHGSEQYSEGFSSEPIPGHTIGVSADSTVQGQFGVTRQGQTLSAWIDRGEGPVLLGSETSAQFEAPMSVQLMVAQVAGLPDSRPSTPLDVRFDNISITADAIVPEPSAIVLLGIGVVSLLAYAWRRRRAI